MKLFHFTSWFGAHGISNYGFVRKGKTLFKGHVDNVAVSLTTNSSHQYLGIPDGRLVDKETADELPEGFPCVRGVDGRTYCLDHAQFRLEFDIPEASSFLVKQSEFYLGEPETLELLAIQTMHPLYASLSPIQQLYLTEKFYMNRRDLDRTNEWWYFLDDLPLEYLTSVSGRIGFDDYSGPISKNDFQAMCTEAQSEIIGD